MPIWSRHFWTNHKLLYNSKGASKFNGRRTELNLIVSQYLEFAELQARNRKAMYMKDWVSKLHGFLTLNDKEILGHKGKISAEVAKQHALKEYDKYKSTLDAAPDELDMAIKALKKENKK